MKQQEKAKAGKVYIRTKKESAPSTYINWKSPAFWPLIDQEAKKQIGKPNHSQLLKTLRGKDPRFSHLRHQSIGEWRDKLIKEQIVWSKKTLDQVRKEFTPGGFQTRFNIFVSAFKKLVISY